MAGVWCTCTLGSAARACGLQPVSAALSCTALISFCAQPRVVSSAAAIFTTFVAAVGLCTGHSHHGCAEYVPRIATSFCALPRGGWHSSPKQMMGPSARTQRMQHVGHAWKDEA